MRYYVVSDVHGYYTYMRQALEKAGFFEDTGPHRLIVCGDLLDRGTEANQMVDFMIELMEKDMLIFILGNHEELLVQCLQEIEQGDISRVSSRTSHHYLNRTWDSILQLSGMSVLGAFHSPDRLVDRVMASPFYRRLLPTAVDYYETPNYIFTHGWIPCCAQRRGMEVKYTYTPDWRRADERAWQKARWYNGMEMACLHHLVEPGKTVVCGHWHTSYGHSRIDHRCSEQGEDAILTPFYAEGIIAIDAATAVSGTVNCLVLED